MNRPPLNSKPVCPKWVPLHHLDSRHLEGLENFLLSIPRCYLSLGYGVNYITQESIRLETGATRCIHVSNICGMTPMGQPVEVSSNADDTLRVHIDPSDEVETSGIDIFVRVNDHKTNNDAVNEKLNKLSVGYRINYGTHPSDIEHKEANTLFLGTVRFSGKETGEGHRLAAWERRPFSCRLEALHGLDGWKEWVRPITEVIGSLLKSAITTPLDEARRIAYYSQIHLLAHRWRTLYIPQLITEIDCLCWILSGDEWSPFRQISWDNPDLSLFSGEKLPKQLADQLQKCLPTEEDGVRLELHEDYSIQKFERDRFDIAFTERVDKRFHRSVPLELRLKRHCRSTVIRLNVPGEQFPLVAYRSANNTAGMKGHRFESVRIGSRQGKVYRFTGIPDDLKEDEIPELWVMSSSSE